MKHRYETKGSSITSLVVGLFLGATIMFGWNYYQNNVKNAPQNMSSTEQEKKPIYWVAPMDANYKRDKPGKSPMGMDLIPFYGDTEGDSNTSPGTIRVSPDVVNNLGVRTAVAKLQPLRSNIRTVGYVKYDEDQLVHIHPRVEGWVETLYVKAAGNPVKKGQPLYEIYSPSLVNAQEEFVMALGRNNKRLIEAAEDRLEALQLPKETIKRLRSTKKVTQTITVVAPQSGVIDNLNIREGFFVKPGTTVMSIGTLDQVWVEAEVFERQVFQVATGLPVTMTLDFLPGKEWQGKVDYIYPALNSKTRTVKLRLRFENDGEELKPNMFAQIVIHPESKEELLLVPRESVIRSGNMDRIVLAMGEGRFKSIAVKVGRYDNDFTEILEGVSPGDRIVNSAQFLLDSESSKTSDFLRMNHDGVMGATGMNEPVSMKENVPFNEESKNLAWTEATINSLMPGHRMINVDHQPIESWGWSSMTMDFNVADSINFAELQKGMTLHIEIEKGDDFQYTITNVHIPDNPMSGRAEQGE